MILFRCASHNKYPTYVGYNLQVNDGVNVEHPNKMQTGLLLLISLEATDEMGLDAAFKWTSDANKGCQGDFK